MEVDIPQYANMNTSTGRKLKQVLVVVARSVPFKPVMQKLADFLIGDKTFEVGGKGKGQKQIADAKDLS